MKPEMLEEDVKWRVWELERLVLNREPMLG